MKKYSEVEIKKIITDNWIHKYNLQTKHYKLHDWHIALKKRAGIYKDIQSFDERRKKLSGNAARRKSKIEDEYCMFMAGYVSNPPSNTWEGIINQLAIDYNLKLTETKPETINNLFNDIAENPTYPRVKLETDTSTIVFQTPDGQYFSYLASKTSRIDPFFSIDFERIRRAITSLSSDKLTNLNKMVENIISGDILTITKADREFIYGKDRDNYLNIKRLTENNKAIRPLSTQNFILHLSSYNKDVEKTLNKISRKISIEYAENLPLVRQKPYSDNSHVLPFNWLNETHIKTAWYEIDLTKPNKDIMHELSKNIRALKKFYYINNQNAQASSAEGFDSKAESASLHDQYILAYLDFKILDFASNTHLKDSLFHDRLSNYATVHRIGIYPMAKIKKIVNSVMSGSYLDAMRAKVISMPFIINTP